MDLGPGIFKDARNETMLLFLAGGAARGHAGVRVVRTTAALFPRALEEFEITQDDWISPEGDPWLVRVTPEHGTILKKLHAARFRLGKLCTINQGLRTGDNETYLAEKPRGATWKAAAGGSEIGRYEPISKRLYVRYEPALLDAPRHPEIFESPAKIVVQEIRNIALPRRIVATLDRDRTYCLQSTNVINPSDSCPLDVRYLLGVLNSAAANYFFRLSFPRNNHIPSNQLARIPVPEPTAEEAERLVALVEEMLSTQTKLAATRTAPEKVTLERQMEALDRRMDRLVYELYALSEAEIRTVEAASNAA
ncbi:MAG: TaqI-like C-terminal specificity domain-containing protein [Gemmatimonadales bacterium]